MSGSGAALQPRAWLRWIPVVFLSVVLARLFWLAWSATARGVDFTDEGIYLVSYRYYRHPEMVYNGAPAFFGPLFQLLGYSVVSLRRLKLALVLLCGVGLGLATARFIREGRVAASRLDALAVRLTIVLFVAVGGFTMYTWLPQSPGYNDLSVLLATALAALVLLVLDGRVARPEWLMAAIGAVLGIAIVNKWPAGFCMVAVVGIAMIVACGWRDAGRRLAWSAAGLVLGCGLLAVFGGRFFDRLTEMRSASEQLSDSLPIWDSYLLPYWRNLIDVMRLIGGRVWLLLAFGIAMLLLVALRRSMILGGAVALGVLLVMLSMSRAGQFGGGDFNVGRSQVVVPMFLVLAGVVWLIARLAASMPTGLAADSVSEPVAVDDDVSQARVRGAAVLVLVGLGGAQAVGTLNPPMFVVISSGALCAAAMVIVVADSAAVWRPALALAAVLLVVFPIAVERMTLSGLWKHPYRLATNLYAETEELEGVIGYNGLSTDPGTAALLRDFAEIARRRDLVGRPGLSVSTSPGYALALGLTHPPADLFISSSEYFADNADIYWRGFAPPAHAD